MDSCTVVILREELNYKPLKINIMEMQKFIELFAEQYDEVDINQLKPETRFRDVDDWSSLVALSVISMIDEEYNVLLKGEDIRNSNTIQDIYNLVVSKKS